MKCEVCQSEEHRALETRTADGAIRRRRKCDRCGHRWTTFERAEAPAVDIEAAREAVRQLETILAGRG